MYAFVYVDVILLRSISSTLIHKLINSLHGTFALKKLEKYEYFLGIEIKHLPMGSMFLTYTKYIQHLLNQVKIYNVNVVTTSMHNSYNSMVGALKYVTLIRSDITSSVNKLNHANSWHILFESQ